MTNPIAGRVAMITGATSGIGEACARMFAENGADLVITGRREGRLEALEEELERRHGVEVTSCVMDVRDRDSVELNVRELALDDKLPDVLVNNAGLARGLDPLQEGDPDDWDEMIDTNVKGLLYVSRAVLPSMVRRNRGHVVNMGSVTGHQVYPKGNVYAATKHAVRALTEALNLDLVGTAVRVSSVSPGLVETEFSEVRFHGDRERAARTYRGYEPLTAADIADIVRYVVSVPDHVNVLDVVVYPTAQRNAYVIDKDDGGS